MNAAQLKKRIEDYQALEAVHPLTCGVNSQDYVKPVIEEEVVILVCENTACTYRQTYIPDLFFDEAFPLFIERQKGQ